MDQRPVPIAPFVMDDDRTVVLGQLQPTAGQRPYPMPTSVDVSQYLSMVIWCPELNFMMGYAPLSLES
ncbi:MAG: DM13 domain-containing protein [Cyanobacteria bacterium P01_D01_bin.6]